MRECLRKYLEVAAPSDENMRSTQARNDLAVVPRGRATVQVSPVPTDGPVRWILPHQEGLRTWTETSQSAARASTTWTSIAPADPPASRSSSSGTGAGIAPRPTPLRPQSRAIQAPSLKVDTAHLTDDRAALRSEA